MLTPFANNALLTAAILLVTAATGRAIVVFDGPVNGQNISGFPSNGATPLDAYVGNYNGGSGVLVAPDLVLTTLHLIPGVGGTFTYQGHAYGIASAETIGNTQISIMHLSASTGHAGVGLYSGTADAASLVTLVGYGGPKGADYNGNPNAPSGSRTGWNWTGGAATSSWGQNVTDANNYQDGKGANYVGFAFTASAGSSIYTGGDSGGGMFINDGGLWKLAGIAWSVDGYFSVPSGDATRNPDQVASIFNVPGSNVYTVDSTGHFFLATTPEHGYASRIADPGTYATLQADILRLSTAPAPEPGTLSVLLLGSALLFRRRKCA